MWLSTDSKHQHCPASFTEPKVMIDSLLTVQAKGHWNASKHAWAHIPLLWTWRMAEVMQCEHCDMYKHIIHKVQHMPIYFVVLWWKQYWIHNYTMVANINFSNLAYHNEKGIKYHRCCKHDQNEETGCIKVLLSCKLSADQERKGLYFISLFHL